MLFRQVTECDPDRRQEQHTLHGVLNLATKILKAMFDIKAKCAENQRKFCEHEGQLRQEINTFETGEEAYCDNCGAALKDTELNYELGGTGVRS